MIMEITEGVSAGNSAGSQKRNDPEYGFVCKYEKFCDSSGANKKMSMYVWELILIMWPGNRSQPPEKIPHLVDDTGAFRKSGRILKENRVEYIDGIIYHFAEDPYPYEEILLETENQGKTV